MDEIAFEYLQRALEQFYAQDKNALELLGMERSYVFRIAFYLQTLINADPSFNNIVVDCEYSKRMNQDYLINNKKIQLSNNKKKPMIVDLIVHTRNSHENNLLIVEFKGWWNTHSNSWNDDHYKLLYHTKQPEQNTDQNLGYDMGVFVMLGKNTPSFITYKNGKTVIPREEPRILYNRRKQ